MRCVCAMCCILAGPSTDSQATAASCGSNHTEKPMTPFCDCSSRDPGSDLTHRRRMTRARARASHGHYYLHVI